jgi:hypothetical protein
MTPVAGVNDFDADRDADFVLITEYVTHRASPEAMRMMNHRYRTEPRFRAKADPIIAIWTLPFLAVELTESGDAIVQPANDRFAKPSRQAVWDGFHASLGLESIAVDDIDNDDTDPSLYFPPPPSRPDRSHSKWRRMSVLLLVAVASASLSWFLTRIRDAWVYGVADYYGGRALAAGAAFWRPDMYQAAFGQEQTVALPTADVHLGSMSRLSIGWTGMGAIDGEADVVVHDGGKLVLWVGDVPFEFAAGRFHITHPLGPKARINVYSGSVGHRTDQFGPGAEITAESRGKQTTITVRDPDGRVRPPVTLTNNATRS